MDKDYSKYYIIPIIALILGIIVFGVKDLVHRNHINKLLLVQSSEYNVKPEKIDNDTINEVKEIFIEELSEKAISTSSDKETEENEKDDIEKSNTNKKILASSNKVEKKTQKGEDFISDNEAILNKDITTVDISNKNINTNLNDIQLLARLIQSEAGNEPYMGKLAVGNVVLHRVKEDKSNIEDTIYKKGQFDGVNTNNFYSQPNNESIQAAIEVLNGREVLSDSYFFVNLNVASPSCAKTDNFITRIGDHWFFRKE